MAHADADRKPLCQGRARNDRQPRASENQCNDGGMISSSSCDLLRWVSEQAELSPHLQGVLLRLARLMDASGALTLPQARIAPAIGLGETQTRAAIKALVAAGVVVRKRRGAVGAGRQCDVIQANLERQHDNSGVSTVSPVSDDNSETPLLSSLSDLPARDNSEPSTVSRNDNSGNPPVDNSPRACIVHVPARAQTLNSNTRVSSNSEREESSLERGLGSGLFGEAALPDAPAPAAAKPGKPKRRPRRAKFYATDEAMPAEPNPEMLAYAAGKGMRNGTLAEQHGKFRRWHIRERTLIACLEQRWETWVDNWARNNPMKPEGGAPPGYRLGGIGPDGKQRYLKDQRLNFYR